MKEVEYKTYKNLLENNSVSFNKIPRSVINSDIFKGLLNADILEIVKAGRGRRITIIKESEFKEFFKNSFPEDNVSQTKSGNIKKYRDSKATSKTERFHTFFLRGFTEVKINNKSVDLKYHTTNFGVFAFSNSNVECNKVCFVENLETFMKAEKLLGNDYLFVHKYGRIGLDSLSFFNAKEYLVFVDYDFNGLDEYLRIKKVFTDAVFYFPSNYDNAFKKYSKTLKGNKAKMSNAVKQSKEKIVIEIREQVSKTNKFLEQEYLIND